MMLPGPVTRIREAARLGRTTSGVVGNRQAARKVWLAREIERYSRSVSFQAVRSASRQGIAMRLERLRLEFDPEEDRLRLVILIEGTAEVRLWLTRRMTARLWTALVKMAEWKPEIRVQPNPEGRSAMVRMQHEQALQEVKFGQSAPPPPSEPPRVQPLGAGELLVTRVQARREADGRTLVALLPVKGEGAHLTLSENLLHGFMKLVQQGAEKAQWGLVLELPADGLTASNDGDTTRVLN